MKQLFYSTVVLALTAFTVSCQNTEEQVSSQEKPNDAFVNVGKTTFPKLASLDVCSNGKGNGPRKSGSLVTDSAQTVYVKPGDGLGSVGDLKPFTGKTLKELIDYLEFAGASFSMNNDGTAIDSVSISISEAKDKLNPLVDESYMYLAKFGFSESELRSLVADNNTSEESLVLLMLTLREYNESVSSGLLSPPKPGGTNTQEESDFLKQAAGCALEAIGADLFAEFAETIAQEGFKNLNKRVIIKIFKKIATRYCNNVVGIAIAAYEWAHCMNYV